MTTNLTQLKRRGLLQAAIAAGVFGASSVPISAAPKQGGLLRAAFSGDVFNCAMRNGTVFENLTRISPDGLLLGELATSWQSNADATRWTFELRRGVAFHDDRPFDAGAVVAVLSAALTKNAKPNLWAIRNIRKTGRNQVEISMTTGTPDLPYLLAHPSMTIRTSENVGTGLYRIDGFENGVLQARRVAAHYKDGSAGWFDELEIHQIETQTKREVALLDRMVDVINLTQNPVRFNNVPNRRAEVIALNGAPALAKNSRLTGERRIGDGWACHNICIPTQWSMA